MIAPSRLTSSSVSAQKAKRGGVAAGARFLVEADEGTRFAAALGGIGDFGLRGADLRETERRE